MTQRTPAGLVLLLAMTLALAPAAAQLPVPAGLSVGDTYQLAFSTSVFTPATASNIGFYNNFVQSVADGAGIGSSLGVQWKAIASTATVHARDNAVVGATTPVYNLRAGSPEKIADGFADMWDGTLDAPLLYDEHGERNVQVFQNQEFAVDAWTGSQTNGLRDATGLTLGGAANSQGWCGRVSLADTRWVRFSQPFLSTQLSLYALSEILTVTDADFNQDTRVGGRDFMLWQRGKGGPGALSKGDANGDGVVDGQDLRLWESAYGQGVLAGSVATTIPEPAVAGLAAAALLTAGVTTSGRTVRRRSVRQVRL